MAGLDPEAGYGGGAKAVVPETLYEGGAGQSLVAGAPKKNVPGGTAALGGSPDHVT